MTNRQMIKAMHEAQRNIIKLASWIVKRKAGEIMDSIDSSQYDEYRGEIEYNEDME